MGTDRHPEDKAPASEVLRTARLELRPPLPHDFDAFFSIFSDSRTHAHSPASPLTRTGAAELFAALRNDWMEHGCGIWAICLQGLKHVIGFGGFEHAVHDNEAYLTLSYRLAFDAWHEGYATEAVSGMLRYAAIAWKGLKIRAIVHPRNPASIRVLEKCGFVPAGRTPGAGSDDVYLVYQKLKF